MIWNSSFVLCPGHLTKQKEKEKEKEKRKRRAVNPTTLSPEDRKKDIGTSLDSRGFLLRYCCEV
jgi:hypothetical protein